MCKTDDASEVLVFRALLGGGGTRRCASQPRSWRQDAARPRKRSRPTDCGLELSTDGHAGVAVVRGVLGRRGQEAGSC